MHDYRLLLPALICWGIAIIKPADYLVLSAIGALVLLAGLLNRRWLLTICGIAVLASCVTGVAHAVVQASDAVTKLATDSATVSVNAVIDSYPRYRNGGYSARANVHTITSGTETHTSTQGVLIRWSESVPHAAALTRGSDFHGTGTLRSLPADFSAVAALELSDVQEVSEPSTTETIRSALKEAVADRPWHAQLIPGVVVGDDTGLPEDATENMRILGLSHLTAVSGSHVSLAIGVVLAIIGRTRPLLAGLVSLLALAGLVELVGAEASVLRAGYMGIFVCIAVAIRRSSSAFPLLCLTVLIVALTDLDLARSLGFQLSAIATGAIIAFGYPLQRHLREHMPSALADVLAISVIAAVATGPLLFRIQEVASLWSAIANALVAPVVAPLTILGMAGALALPVAPFVAVPVLRVCELFTGWMAGVTHVLISFPGSHLPTPVAFAGQVCILAAVVCAIWREKLRMILIAVGVLFCSAALVPFFLRLPVLTPGSAKTSNWEAIQCDVGQGSAFVARRGGRTVLMDVGPEGGNISGCMEAAGIEHLDLLIISHFDADHVRGLEELLATVTVAEVWYSRNLHPHYNSDPAFELLDSSGIQHRSVAPGETYRDDTGETFIDVVGPRITTGAVTSTNADSLVVVMNTDSHRVLVLSDAPYERQVTLTGVVHDIDVVIAGHHGAADQSPELAESLNPRISLFSVGENDYGHPTERALEIWDAPIVARTDQCGMITLTAQSVISGC
ncbi:ComEC/Rec2 family competence protein [Trueperella bialowiezensis]|uniref:ComEC family competence protein n=1 Tax=Trueperella bialowiezensis TaxID=312285 RepID=A0A3S4X742_9ACTO|nr:ComEC/Rec2 family competence protein [Trueperella bialowiezensis]VEI14090.1 ComEC family competence protein [Trueperella bialowiezensis]